MIHLYIKDYISPKRWWHFFFPPKQHNKEIKRVMTELNEEKPGLDRLIAMAIPQKLTTFCNHYALYQSLFSSYSLIKCFSASRSLPKCLLALKLSIIQWAPPTK